MSDQRSIERLFGELLELQTPEQRQEYLDQVGPSSDPLRKQLEELVAAHDRAGSFLLDDGEAAPTEDGIPGMEIGMQIGPYKLREQIGEGGMGVVYVAEQSEPLRRKVALKVIKPGMDSKAVIARFEAERNVLAMMSHPNIAQVLDAGTTKSGHPYFVLELVKGIPITEYCDQHRMSIRDRLELFNSVCQAIQHAHQKGIIHRDIKPNNVLITELDGKPVAKVIDFGVAKALNQTLTQHSIYTSFQAVVGTPLYMSPEQASLSSVDVDTRSDVYSLGVLLYELLTGTTPFEHRELKQVAQDEVLRFIREKDPPRPSNRISTLGKVATRISQVRDTVPDQLGRQVKGDLDWIVMKALEKERGRRYKTTDALVTDIERHLRSEPVEARPASAAYRFSRFYRRNRAVVLTTVAILLVLVLAIAGTTSALIQAVKASQSEKHVRVELEQTLDDLRRSALREMILEALAGNKESVEKTLNNSDTLRIKDADVSLLRSIIALNDGEYLSAIALAEAAESGDSDIQSESRLGALSVQAIGSFWYGSFDRYAEHWNKLFTKEAKEDIEAILQAYMLTSCSPFRAKDLLIKHPDVASTPFGLFVRTQANHLEAVRTHDHDLLDQVVQDFRTCGYLLRNSMECKRWIVQSHCAAIDFAKNDGQFDKAEALRKQVKDLVEEIEKDPDNQYITFWFYRSTGDIHNADWAADHTRRDAFCLFVAAWYRSHESFPGALARFDRTTDKAHRTSKHAVLARAHLLADSPDGREEIIYTVTPLLGDSSGLIRRHALAALCLACDAQQINEYGRRAMQHATASTLAIDETEILWLSDSLEQFFAYPETETELLQKAKKAGKFAEGNAHYMIGMYRLAEGNYEKARQHFDAVVATEAKSIDFELGLSYSKKLPAE
jgi:serine/threonine protein kinase